MCAHLGEIVGATGDIEGTGALIIRQPEEFLIFLFCKKNYFCICFFCISGKLREQLEGTGALIIRHPEELLIHPERKFFISQFGFEFVVFDKYPDKK